ncbi:hypothetical protein H2203_007362 [Taxawa tesnikishii (nom. ined.)]|nr:hypothetical protein H2203_007362 [Dothideales sp. JES 119]
MCFEAYELVLYSCGHHDLNADEYENWECENHPRNNPTNPCKLIGLDDPDKTITRTFLLKTCPEHKQRPKLAKQAIQHLLRELIAVFGEQQNEVRRILFDYAKIDTGLLLEFQQPLTAIFDANRRGELHEYLKPLHDLRQGVETIVETYENYESWNTVVIPGYSRAVTAKPELEKRVALLDHQLDAANLDVWLINERRNARIRSRNTRPINIRDVPIIDGNLILGHDSMDELDAPVGPIMQFLKSDAVITAHRFCGEGMSCDCPPHPSGQCKHGGVDLGEPALELPSCTEPGTINPPRSMRGSGKQGRAPRTPFPTLKATSLADVLAETSLDSDEEESHNDADE